MMHDAQVMPPNEKVGRVSVLALTLPCTYPEAKSSCAYKGKAQNFIRAVERDMHAGPGAGHSVFASVNELKQLSADRTDPHFAELAKPDNINMHLHLYTTERFEKI